MKIDQNFYLNSNSVNGNKGIPSSTSSNLSNISDLIPENTSGACIKVGNEFQVNLSEYDPNKQKLNRDQLELKEFPIWKPTEKLEQQQIDDFLKEAMEHHSFSTEQALSFLFWYKHDINNALNNMKKYCPKQDEWTQEQKVLFEQAYSFNGKNFSKIRQLIPNKSQGSLVTYYYNWKKSKAISQIESQQNNAKNSNNDYQNDNEEENSDDNESVDDTFINSASKICSNCDMITSQYQSTPKGQLCIPCFDYFKKTGLMRPDHVINKSLSNGNLQKHNCTQNNSLTKTNRYLTISNAAIGYETSNVTNTATISKEAKNFHKSLRKPPKGIYLNYDELMDLVKTGPDTVFEELQRKNTILRREHQKNKQEIDLMIKKFAHESELLKAEINKLLFDSETNDTNVTPFWTQKEINFVLQGFNKFGDDFELISQLIQTKSPESVKAFYAYYKDSLNLEKLVTNNTDLNKKSIEIMANLKKNNRHDIQVKFTE
ncbi:REST corepressor 3-like isoform X2 [Brachionus plicatilis]|uniref:REST corepressor 3-like isoform X2 n=1 Tax=Brachionus plicatilis TaxID=10195 RepID=A0A3M7TAU8_BRAPC|nr:REST corepressor 3-like isoform X2 [Brachionus plicatilis]